MSKDHKNHALDVIIVGAGPAGLMAAYTISQAFKKYSKHHQAIHIHVFDQMPSAGRKFLRAGIGGLNLTHSEPLELFRTRFSSNSATTIESHIAHWFEQFSPTDLREFVAELGFETFVGSSGRVFPTNMKAAPILRAFISRLREMGVEFHMRWQWLGWDNTQAQTLLFRHHERDFQDDSFKKHEVEKIHYDAVLFALGGGSWAKLGSDGAWQAFFQEQHIPLVPLQAANCGFDVCGKEGDGWSEYFTKHYAGSPFKSIALTWQNECGVATSMRGECVVTATGIEGGLIYHASQDLRQALLIDSPVCCYMDLLPAQSLTQVTAALFSPREKMSLTTFLRKKLNLSGVKVGVLYELLHQDVLQDMAALAIMIKRLPVFLKKIRPLDEAISTAGGVALDALTSELMLKNHPGVFCAGEMLDWEAPTGGYLLSASFATGKVAGMGLSQYLSNSQ